MSAKDFQLQLSKEWQDTRENIAEAIAGIGLVLLTGIVRKSPVAAPEKWKRPDPSYVGGRFRGNWITSIGSIDGRELDAIDKTGSKSINEGAAKLEAYPDTLPEIYVQNNLPYALPLENGWSDQAPAGMVALTIAEVEAQFDGDLV